jgi:hypothetical protein
LGLAVAIQMALAYHEAQREEIDQYIAENAVDGEA